MEENIGHIERIIGILTGIGLSSLAFIGPVITWKWAYLGLLPIATGIVGCCPVYVLFGISTCKTCKPCK
ncbi:MAG TPA: DUF2892 domain-containing protein [Nitrospirota bacterium]|nr:DUF2892 domain-containing protein [Nitrospirota bacterium]